MITTHVLDTATGRPAAGVTVTLEIRQASEWVRVGRGATDGHGRLTTLTGGGPHAPGTYRLTFDVGAYHREQGVAMAFFPEVTVIFSVRDIAEQYHVPLLVSPFGYTTYRGA
jgi:5-hydroxyisourate hydrolase